MVDNLRFMNHPQHWRITSYEGYIEELKIRMALDRNRASLEKDKVLLQGWKDLKREFEEKLREEAEHLRESTKVLQA